jgi:hypothetical protein
MPGELKSQGVRFEASLMTSDWFASGRKRASRMMKSPVTFGPPRLRFDNSSGGRSRSFDVTWLGKMIEDRRRHRRPSKRAGWVGGWSTGPRPRTCRARSTMECGAWIASCAGVALSVSTDHKEQTRCHYPANPRPKAGKSRRRSRAAWASDAGLAGRCRRCQAERAGLSDPSGIWWDVVCMDCEVGRRVPAGVLLTLVSRAMPQS